MAVTLDGGTGLFDRLGRWGHLLNTLNGRRGGTSAGDYPKEAADVLAVYAGAANDVYRSVENLLTELEGCQSGHAALLAEIRAACQSDLVESFHNDDPLAEKTVEAALLSLRIQMKTATTRYVDPNSVSATVTQTNNTGNGAVVVHTKDGYGRTLENLLAEDLRITVTDTSTAGSEELRVRGEVSQDDKLHFEWPEGSGVDFSFTAIDASGDDNLLTNGDFELFTVANTPDNWTIGAGAAGTEILSEASTVYKGSKAIEFVGSATNTQIYQALTVADLESRTPYALNLWMKCSGTPAAGVLTMDLHDGSGVITDEEGANQTTTVDLTTLGTTYLAKQLKFSLPEPLPSIVRVRLTLSTALSAGTSLFMDHAAVAQLEQPGNVPGHTPWIGFFSGAANWALDDGEELKTFKIAVANDRASEWQQMFDKLFDTADLGIVLPVSGTTIINDNLIA